MMISRFVAGVFWLSLACDLGGTAPTVQEWAGVGDGSGDAPRVGLVDLEACTTSTTDDACMQNMEIVSALDADEYLSVTAYEKGVLDCGSLEKAEDAPQLRFVLTNSEEVTAKRKSFTVTSGEAFSDNVGRMVWTGEVVETGRVFGGIPRTIAMSWSDCNVETFMLKVKTPQHDGTTRATVTLPCTDPSEPLQVCLLQIDHAAEEEALENLVEDEEEETQQQRQTRDNQTQGQYIQEDYDGMGVAASSGPSHLPSDQDDNLDEEADGNNNTRHRRRHLRKTAEGGDESSTSKSSTSDNGSNSGSDGGDQGYASTSRRGTRRSRRRTAEARRRLAREVSEGMEAARARDPDVDAKDEDVRLLSEYLVASPPEQEAFHGRGVRRLSSAEVQMPSGRILAASTDIDVMVLYTEASLVKSATAGSALTTEQQMVTEILTSYAEANDALADSGISATVNVVHIAQVAFVESSDMNGDLTSIAAGKGEAAGFEAMRDKYGADLVQMIGLYGDSCGTGYVMAVPRAAFGAYAYSIVHVHCLMNLSHIHELGHNIGANHNRESAAIEHEYAHAQRCCTGDVPYRTIMAYEIGCLAAPRVPMFSAKGKTYAGRSLGTATTDNARVIRENLATVVNFRDQVVAPTPASDQSSQRAGVLTAAVDATVPTATAIAASGLEVGTSDPAKRAGTLGSSAEVSSAISIYPTAKDTQRMMRVGCFRDDERDRVMERGTKMPMIERRTSGMTRKNCMAYCTSGNLNFKYFGVEDSETCFCSSNSTDYQRLGEITVDDCGMKCAGDSKATCGGKASIEVFEVKNAAQDQQREEDEQEEKTLTTPTLVGDNSPNSTHQACYSHSWSDVQLQNVPIIDYEHTSRSTCRAHCSASEFAYYALEFGFICSCGDKLPDESRAVTNAACSLPCTGSASQTCGGNWHQAVFSIDTN